MHSPPAVKHVHQAFENYSLLDIRLLQDTTKLNISGAKAWRMNLCALSEQDPTIVFVAVDNNILVYQITPSSRGCDNPVKRLITRPNDIEEQHTINQIKLARIFNEEALVAVTEAGEIWVWRTDQLDVAPVVLSNDGSSTWGIAIHSDQGLVAVSANNHQVTVFNMQNVPAAIQMFGQRQQDIPAVMTKDVDKIHLIGHQGNIPCVDFNYSGRFLASCSIDQTCRIWDVRTGRQVTERQFSTNRIDRNYWCWSVKFVSLRDFKGVECATEQLSQKLSSKINQGRPTALQSLDLCHSATNPVYRVNLPELNRGPTFQSDFIESIYEDTFEDDGEAGPQDERVSRRRDESVRQLRRLLEIYRSTRGAEVDTSSVAQGSEETTDLSSLWQEFRQATALQWREGLDAADMTLDNEGSIEDGAYESSDRSTADASAESGESVVQSPVSGEENQDAEMDFETQGGDYLFDMPNFETPDHDHHIDIERNLLSGWDPNDIDIDSDWFEEGEDEDSVFMQPGPSQGHQLLSAEDHRNLREQLQNERWSINRLPPRTVQSIPVSTKGGWSDTEGDESDDDKPAVTNALEEDNDQDEVPTRRNVVPLVMRSPFLSFNSAASKKKTKKKRDMIERLIVTTPKDLFLLHTNVGSMETVRLERGIVSDVDVRSDRMLVAMDRLNMVEWIPELELFICASQKGTIALMRMMYVRLSDGQQTIIFNHERYLPDHGMQSKSLYGLSARRLPGDYGSSGVYILYLFYQDGATLSYRIARQNDDLFAELLVV